MNTESNESSKSTFSPGNTEIVKIMNSKPYKAIIIYLMTRNPEADVMQFLGEMALRGYLCFLGSLSDSGGIEILEPNLIWVHQGLSLIPVLKNFSAIILSTRNIHPDWEQILHHKLLWFHWDFDLPGEIYDDIYEKADLISYFQAAAGETPNYTSNSRTFNLGGKNQPDLDLLERRIKSTPRGWQVYANLNLYGKVAVMTATFFDFEGEYFYSGGAERYLLDLAELCEELGYEMIVFQYGNYPWMRRFKNICIVSLSRCDMRAEGWILKCARDFNRIFYELVQGRTVLNIYSAFYEAWPQTAVPNIGISHGVSWDNPYCDFDNAAEFWLMQQRYIEGAKACEELVSVDTNTANWFQTVDYNLGQRTKVVPNYVDLTMFKPEEGFLDKSNRVVILYPRQLYSARGFYLVLDVMDDILERYPDVEFHFAGRGGEQDTALVHEKQEKWPDRVKYCSLSMDEMPRAYQAADISLIPSIHSEGTSLSCLEAMASGNAVIASRIGGLSDLIINNYNGLLIAPHPQSLKQAIINLLENRELLNKFKQRNTEVVQAFSKDYWKKRWRPLLKNRLNQSYASTKADSRTVEIKLVNKPVDYSKLGEIVASFLIEGWQVYIRSQVNPDPRLSFGRIQWLGPESPMFSACDVTMEW
ncbi:MAG: glycosyltransferase family 4 protein [Syntrophomonas sp.]